MADINALQYRFSGYQLPMIQLDETGPSYVVLNPHPYYYNQPAYWVRPIQYIGQRSFPEQVPVSNNIRLNGQVTSTTLYRFLPFKK